MTKDTYHYIIFFFCQSYKIHQEGFIGVIDDDDPAPILTLHRKQIEKLLSDDTNISFEWNTRIFSSNEIPPSDLRCYESNNSQFVEACHEGNEAKVDQLLKSAFLNLNVVALCGMNGFMIACKKGFARIVSLIMKYVSERAIEFEPEITSAFVNAKHQKNGQSALTLAVLEGHLEVVKILTEENEFFKVDFNAKDGDRLATPFMYACQSGFKEIVSHLLKLAETRKKKIFDLHARDKNQNTAFHYACSGKFEDIVDLIIGFADKLEIPLDLKNNDGKTGYDLWPEKFEEMVVSNRPGPLCSKRPRVEPRSA